MKHVLVILAALSMLAYLLFEIFLTALQPLLNALSGHVH